MHTNAHDMQLKYICWTSRIFLMYLEMLLALKLPLHGILIYVYCGFILRINNYTKLELFEFLVRAINSKTVDFAKRCTSR